MKRNLVKIIIAIIIIVGVYSVLSHYGVTDYLKPDNIPKIKEKINSFGVIAPLVVYRLLHCCDRFLSARLACYNALWSCLWSHLGGCLRVYRGSNRRLMRLSDRALRRSRHGGRAGSKVIRSFRRIDEGVQRQGWRMLMITRLVPLFPFNLQNYAYGLTKIRFTTYLFVSWICMLPGTAAYVQLGAAVNVGEGNIKKTLIYLAAAGIFIVLVSLIPNLIRKRQPEEI